MRSLALVSLLLATVIPQALRAQQDEPKMPAGLSEGLVARFDEVSDKLAQLAQAIPADKYGWRPTPEVRTVSQAFVHAAMGNYFFLGGTGVKPAAKLKGNEETTITTKPQVIAFLKQATDQMRSSLTSLDDASLNRPAKFFKQNTSAGNVYYIGVDHLHEHLGQLITYARLNGVVPPWSK